MTSLPRVAIVGGSRLGRLIAHYVDETGQLTVVGFFDNNIPKGTVTEHGVILDNTQEIRRMHADGLFDGLMIGVGYVNQHWRERFFEEYQDLPRPSLIHPTAYVNPSAHIGAGVVVLPGVIVDANCSIEDNVFLNPGAIVAHDSTIGAHTFVGPGAMVSGFATVGKNCFLGLGAKVINDVALCDGCQLGAGAVVTKSLETSGVYAGVPARLLR
jgi:sugar O-acyltransferase (sialic acid O-acetyltransferase NeuD family)